MKYAILLSLVVSFSARADDCDFIRNALAALPEQGGEVLVPEGTYNCGAPIVLSRSNVSLRGAGRDKVTIRLADHIHAPLLIIGDPKTVRDEHGQYVVGHRVSNIKVYALTLDGNRKNHDASKECGEGSCDGDAGAVRNNGITIRGANDILVENVTAHSTISGGMVTEKYCAGLTVRDFESYDNYFDGFAGYETERSDFSQLFLHHNRGAGISIDINFNNNVIRDSRLHDNSDVGIFARNLKDNRFQRLSILRSGNHGVFLANDRDSSSCARDNSFESVIINESKRSGIRLNNDCKGNRVTGASDLCRNLEGGFSEETKQTLLVDESVLCR